VAGANKMTRMTPNGSHGCDYKLGIDPAGYTSISSYRLSL
jgi:hypothetical protein